MITLLGLPNCDTCRAARKALEAAGHSVALRDVRASPPSETEWAELLALFGPSLVNRRSTTWRGLPEDARAQAPEDLLRAQPALMKRPVLRGQDKCSLGWDAAARRIWGL